MEENALGIARTSILAHAHIHTQGKLALSLKWTLNGAIKWRELTAVETKTGLTHQQWNMWDLTQRVFESQHEERHDYQDKNCSKRQFSVSFHHLKPNVPEISAKCPFKELQRYVLVMAYFTYTEMIAEPCDHLIHWTHYPVNRSENCCEKPGYSTN